MYDGPRPDARIAGTCGSGGGAIQLQKCVPGSITQTWSFESDGQSIASNGQCIDIENYRTQQGSPVWAYTCGGGRVQKNEFWALKDGTIASLQPNTPFCLGVSIAPAHACVCPTCT